MINASFRARTHTRAIDMRKCRRLSQIQYYRGTDLLSITKFYFHCDCMCVHIKWSISLSPGHQKPSESQAVVHIWAGCVPHQGQLQGLGLIYFTVQPTLSSAHQYLWKTLLQRYNPGAHSSYIEFLPSHSSSLGQVRSISPLSPIQACCPLIETDG